jgi:hypothetical protein
LATAFVDREAPEDSLAARDRAREIADEMLATQPESDETQHAYADIMKAIQAFDTKGT